MMIKYYAMAGAGLALFAGGWFISGTLWQSKWDAHMLADAQANEKAATEALTKQQKLIKDLDDAKRTTVALQEEHDRNVSDSRAAAERLRSELAETERRLDAEISAMDARDGAYHALNGARDGSDELVALAEWRMAEIRRLRADLAESNAELKATRFIVGSGAR